MFSVAPQPALPHPEMDTGQQPKTTLTAEGSDVTTEGEGWGRRVGFKPQTACTAKLGPAELAASCRRLPHFIERRGA